MNLTNSADEDVRSIEVLIKALGTMVMEPQYENDPSQIGVKRFLTNIQKPIMEGQDRVVLSNKLMELVDKL